jgi:hypothetical protein
VVSWIVVASRFSIWVAVWRQAASARLAALRLRQHRDHGGPAQQAEIAGLVAEVVDLAQHCHVAPHDCVGRVAHRADLLQCVEPERHDHDRDREEAEEDASTDREVHGRAGSGWGVVWRRSRENR